MVPGRSANWTLARNVIVPSSPRSFLLFCIMLRKQPETEVPKVTRNQAFPSTVPWGTLQAPVDITEACLGGDMVYFPPWIALMFIGYKQMRCLLNNVQYSIGHSHFQLLLSTHHQTGARGIGRGRRKNHSSQRGNPQRGSIFGPHQRLFLRKVWRQKLKKPQWSEIREWRLPREA